MRSVLHIDMNACYASIECLYDPSIRNLPVAVGGDVEAKPRRTRILCGGAS